MRESVFISVIDPEGRINKSEIPVQNTRTISLGREMGTNTVQLPFRFVSGRHGEITFEGNKIYYRDLNSSNGWGALKNETYVMPYDMFINNLEK